MAETFRITELDFTQIKQNLKEYLRTKPEYQDYDFDGSGWAFLIDLLAYNTAYNGFYLNMVGNEMFLDSAVLRSSAVSRAKLLSYLPQSKRSALAKLDITFAVDPLDLPPVIYISRDVKFRAVVNQKTYFFNVMEPHQVYPDDSGVYKIEQMEIVEGDRITHRFNVDNNIEQRFIIPNSGVDTDSILVTVQESAYNLGVTNYSLATDITELTADSKVYYLQEVDNNKYEVYFGDDIISYKPKTGNVVLVEYIISNGSLPNGISSFEPVTAVGTASTGTILSTSISTYQSAAGGADEESLRSIKYKAPLNFEVQNRAVTKQDYEYLLPREYSNIDSISVWGGEDNVPAMYGHVFFAIKPAEGFILDAREKEYLKNTVIRDMAMLCQIPIIVDPSYTHLMVDAYIKYDYYETKRTQPELQRDIYEAILAYGETELSKFNKTFVYSQFIQTIYDVNSAITEDLVKVRMKMTIYPTLEIPQQYVIYFNNTFDIYDATDYYGKAVRSTDFIYNNNKTCFIAEESFASTTLSVFQKNQSTTNPITKVEDIGTIDYTNGIITIDRFVPDAWIGQLNYITFFVKPKIYNVTPYRNQILIIAPEDVIVRVEAVR